MGRQIITKLICDVCKDPVEEREEQDSAAGEDDESSESTGGAISGVLRAKRGVWSMQFHDECLRELVANAESISRRRSRGRPRSAVTGRGPGRPRKTASAPTAAPDRAVENSGSDSDPSSDEYGGSSVLDELR